MNIILTCVLSLHFSFLCALALQIPGNLLISIQYKPIYLSSGVPRPLSTAGTSVMENTDEDTLSHFTEVICSKATAELEELLHLWTRAESM